MDEAFREIVQSLVKIALRQDSINDDLRQCIVEIKETQKQIASLLERLVNPGGNGSRTSL